MKDGEPGCSAPHLAAAHDIHPRDRRPHALAQAAAAPPPDRPAARRGRAQGLRAGAAVRVLEGGKAKVEIGLARGKKQHDKRADERDRDWQREKSRVMKHRG
jgi:hypothetical protein